MVVNESATRCPETSVSSGMGREDVNLFDNVLSDVGCDSRPPHCWGTAPPTVATGHQSLKQGGNRIQPASDGTTPGASDDGQRKQTSGNTRRQTNQAPNADRWACPKRG
jgi:hypothetical protein